MEVSIKVVILVIRIKLDIGTGKKVTEENNLLWLKTKQEIKIVQQNRTLFRIPNSNVFLNLAFSRNLWQIR